MKTGDLVLTNSLTVRSEPGPRPGMTAGFKAIKGHAFLMLNFGTVASLDEVDNRVEKVMEALGWVPADNIEKLRQALADAEAEAAKKAVETAPAKNT